MRKISFLIIFLFLFSTGTLVVFADEPLESDKIYWDKNRPLQWNDFEGKVGIFDEDYVGEKDVDAYIIKWLEYEYDWDYIQNKNCKYEITYFDSWASFVKSESWVKEGVISDMDLLNHEQRHFDIHKIGELNLKEMVKKDLLNKTFPCDTLDDQSIDGIIEEKIGFKIKTLFDSVNAEIEKMDIEYDIETEHGLVEEKQKEWNHKIDCLLEISMDENKCKSSQNSRQVKSLEIPSWIKNNAGWWAEGKIEDHTFLQGISFLIKEGIMIIPSTETSGTSESKEVPDWIKNNAGWWAEGQIDDGTFVTGIQFLVKNGIISVQHKSN